MNRKKWIAVITPVMHVAIGLLLALLAWFEVRPFIQRSLLRNVNGSLNWPVFFMLLLFGMGLISVGAIIAWKNRSVPLVWSWRTTPLVLVAEIVGGLGAALTLSLLVQAVLWLLFRAM